MLRKFCCVVSIIFFILLFYNYIFSQTTNVKWEIIRNKDHVLDNSLEYTVMQATINDSKESNESETFNKINLHRLKSKNLPIKGVIFILPGTNSNAEEIMMDTLLVNNLKAVEKHRALGDYSKDYLDTISSDIESFKQRRIAILLALNGYDIYSMDYRHHFIPADYTAKDCKFASNWGWDFFVGDVKIAMNKVKEISGSNKVFLVGESFGGMLATVYASRYWAEDLAGIILIDGGNGGKWKLQIPIELWKLIDTEIVKRIPDLPDWTMKNGTLIPQFVQVLIDSFLRTLIFGMNGYMSDLGSEGGFDYNSLINKFLHDIGVDMTLSSIPHYEAVSSAMLSDLLAPAIDPITNKQLTPAEDKFGKPLKNFMEWFSERAATQAPSHLTSNLYNGFNSRHSMASLGIIDRLFPLEVYLEVPKMFDIVLTTSNKTLDLLDIHINLKNLPKAIVDVVSELSVMLSNDKTVENLSKAQIIKKPGTLNENLKQLFEYSYKQINEGSNYMDNVKNIDVPLLSFQSIFGYIIWGPFENGIKNKDVKNGGTFTDFGHLDMYSGYNYEAINLPTLNWLNERIK